VARTRWTGCRPRVGARCLALWAGLLLAGPSHAGEPGSTAPAQHASQAAPVVPAVRLAGDWVIVEESAQELVLRRGSSAEGVRIVLAPTADGRRIGVSPIHDGRTLERRTPAGVVPLIGWPYPDHAPTAVHVDVQGPDLLVRMQGPPLSTVTDHPDAPDDPVLSWVRLRPRGSSWRIALRGVQRLSLPPLDGVEHRGADRVITSSWGSFEIRSDAPVVRSHSGPRGATWDTSPSVDAAYPYPRTGITWRP